MKSLPRWVWIAVGACALYASACANDDSLNPQPLPPQDERGGGGSTTAPAPEQGSSGGSGGTPNSDVDGKGSDGGADADSGEGGD
jgi:hypothetical protein